MSHARLLVRRGRFRSQFPVGSCSKNAFRLLSLCFFISFLQEALYHGRKPISRQHVILSFSDFTNGSNRYRLQEQLCRLVALYDKPFLIVEADRAPRDSRARGDPSPVPDASSIIFKPNSPYFLQTCAALAQTETLRVLHSESQGEFLLKLFFLLFLKSNAFFFLILIEFVCFILQSIPRNY